MWFVRNMRRSYAIGPLAHRAHIHMHELIHRIVPYTAAMEFQRRIAQCRCRHAWHADVDCLGQHMLAVLGYAARSAALSQECVAPRSPVTADDIDHAIWSPQLGHQRV